MVDDTPSPAEFSGQLISQLLTDLDGVLSDGEMPSADARGLIVKAARDGGLRGAILVLLTQAACNAYRRLLDEPSPIEAIDVLITVYPELIETTAALFRHADRLSTYVAEAEHDGERPEIRLADSIHELYAGLGNGDETASARGLVTLRALINHIDAAAQLLSTTDAASRPPACVIRPDKFHDHFLRMVEDVSKRQADEMPVAALTRDGRLTAIVTDDRHPIDAAATSIRHEVSGDERQRDDAVTRMLALVDAIDRLRRENAHALGDFADDAMRYAGLITAAATTPLASGAAGFHLPALAQVARYNHSLLLPRGHAPH